MSNKLHSRSGRIMAIIATCFSGIGIVALATDSIEVLLIKSWIYIWFGFVSWLLFWHPSVVVTEDEILVDNIFRSTRLNYSAIQRIDTKYTLSLETTEGTIRAFAAPAPSRYAGLLASRTEAEHLPESSFIGQGQIRPGDLTTSDSGVAAYLIRTNWEKLRDLGKLNETSRVDTKLHTWRIIVFAVLSASAVLGFIS